MEETSKKKFIRSDVADGSYPLLNAECVPTDPRYAKKSLGQLMVEEMKTEGAYSKALAKEKEMYDKYLKAVTDRAVKMEQWLNAQREVEIMKKRMGVQGE